jgi:multisubunit Na+/H+ antiporter MnhB subunit
VSIAVFDVLFCIALLGLAWSAMRAREIFSGIVLFIVFGLLLALAWARLRAPDLALTEAALGAGLVGALFLGAQRRVGSPAPGRRAAGDRAGRGRGAQFLVLLPLAPVFYAACAGWVRTGGAAGEGLAGLAYAGLPRSGVANPVTAVLLNYRAYDTLLELCVLLLAVLSVHALHPDGPRHGAVRTAADEVLTGYCRAVVPVILLVAGYVLWAGSHRPGGAFQAGSILAGAGVLLLLGQGRGSPDYNRLRVRLALVAGFTVFAGLGLLLLPRSPAFLQWPPEAAKALIVAIESAATLSIGVTLALLFCACADLLIPAAAGGAGEGEARS